MDPISLTFDASEIPLVRLTGEIKAARAVMLRQHGPNAYVYYHRQLEIEHEDSQWCWCDPVVIAQNDHRPSVYFANEILNPVLH